MPFDKLNFGFISNLTKYNKILHCGNSNALDILFTREIAKRLETKGVKNIYVN
jgi:hypothetical protein